MANTKVKIMISLLLLIGFGSAVKAQEKGTLHGDFQGNASFYDYDSKIGTYTQVYKKQLSSAESWLLLNYKYQGYTFTMRYDLYNNSPLWVPTEAYSKQGLGFYSVSKDFDKVNITVGSFYDQFGTGISFRAFEDRTIGLDYAIQGVRVKYNPSDSLRIKAFSGVQKFRFDIHPQVIKGINVERTWGIGKVGMESGVSAVNRTLDDDIINQLASSINGLPEGQRFVPKYNVYVYDVYNTFKYKNFSLFGQFAYKTKETIVQEVSFNDFQTRNKDGYVIYSGLNYSTQGFGMNLQYKKIETFVFRTDPYQTLNLGLITYLPPLSKQHSFRLPARYGISSRDQGEQGVQGELTISPADHDNITIAGAYIINPINQNKELYREYYIDYNKKYNKYIRQIIGIQYLHYDQRFYQAKADAPMVKAFTPFTELSIKLDKTLRKSIRIEAQYMFTRQDVGDFAVGVLEFNYAPHYSFSVTDMVNTRPLTGNVVHYPTFFGSYSYKQTRVTAGYIKQVSGVVCTGGVCRLEPAFSGFKIGMTTNF